MGENYSTTDSLKEKLIDTLPEHEHTLFAILDIDKKGVISENDFYSIMRPWASFSATDINGDGELDVIELKCLIWLMNDEEPTEYRVQRDMKAIDADKSGYVGKRTFINLIMYRSYGVD